MTTTTNASATERVHVHDCANCTRSGEWHVHPAGPAWPGLFGRCTVHPDAPGDL